MLIWPGGSLVTEPMFLVLYWAASGILTSLSVLIDSSFPNCIYSPLPPPKSEGENIPQLNFLSTQPYLQQQKKLEQFWAYINYNISWLVGGECWFWELSGIWYWSCAYRHMPVFRNTHKETQFYTKGIYINPLWSRRTMKTSLVFAGCIPYYWEVQSNQRDCRVVCVVMHLFRSNSIGKIFLAN